MYRIVNFINVILRLLCLLLYNIADQNGSKNGIDQFEICSNVEIST